MNPIPIFLVSLPRSGSTLLQKMLMSHIDIASTAEPWFLLPLCYMRKKKGVTSPYGHVQSVNAFSRIISECGKESIDNSVREFVYSIYSSYCKNGEKFFLDKTPRYYWILDELLDLFPDGKFVVLLRNPVSIFSSSLEAFRNNSMRRIDHLDSDFCVGPKLIGKFVKNHIDSIKLVSYEQLIDSPEQTIEDLCNFIGVGYNEHIIKESFNISLKGHGDHLGAARYKTVKQMPEKWKEKIDTWYRKKRLIKYINEYSTEYLEAGGYNKKKMLSAIYNLQTKNFRVKEFLYLFEEILVRIYKRPLGRTHGRA